MARKNLNEACIFCGKAPCECGGEPKVKATKKKATKPTKAAPAPVAPKFKKEEDKKPERDLSYESALRALYDIVSPADQAKIRAELDRPVDQELDRRRADWMKKHG